MDNGQVQCLTFLSAVQNSICCYVMLCYMVISTRGYSETRSAIESSSRKWSYAPHYGSRTIRRRTIRRWTIRRGQLGATIRLGQFGAKYDINFIESSAFIQQYSFHQSRFYFSKILFINPTSISAIVFHQSRLVLDIMS